MQCVCVFAKFEQINEVMLGRGRPGTNGPGGWVECYFWREKIRVAVWRESSVVSLMWVPKRANYQYRWGSAIPVLVPILELTSVLFLIMRQRRTTQGTTQGTTQVVSEVN